MNSQQIIDKYLKRILIDYPENDKIMIDLMQFSEEIINQFESEKECEHPYFLVNSKCNGEINHCLKCGKRF